MIIELEEEVQSALQEVQPALELENSLVKSYTSFIIIY